MSQSGVQAALLAQRGFTGDLEVLKAAYRSTSNACKACHDVYTSQ